MSGILLVVLVVLPAGLGGLVADLLQTALVVAAFGAAAGFFVWTKVKHALDR